MLADQSRGITRNSLLAERTTLGDIIRKAKEDENAWKDRESATEQDLVAANDDLKRRRVLKGTSSTSK